MDPGGGVVIDEYLHLLRDPAHLLVELTFVLLVDLLLLGVIVPWVRRSIRRDHLEQDAEHGVVHVPKHRA